MGGGPATEEITLADFTLAENDAVMSCPAGHAPKQVKIKVTDHRVALSCRTDHRLWGEFGSRCFLIRLASNKKNKAP